MNTWAPLWSKIVDSSLWVEPYYVRVLFLTMVALKDKDDIVRYTAFALARRGNMTEKEVLEGLKVLSGPDTRRLEPQPFDGRRIEKVEDGWLVLNGKKYREMMKREYNARKQAEYREEKKKAAKSELPRQTPSAREREHVRAFEAGDVDEHGNRVTHG